MSLSHLHLMLNHVPMLGVIFGILLLLNAHFRKSHDILRVALKMFVLAALMTVPVFFTGDYAASAIRELPTFSKALSDAHENAAVIAYIAVGALGLMGVWGLFLFHKKRDLPKFFTKAIFVLSLVTAASFVYVANTGGVVNHPELRPGFVAPAFQEEED
jgi:uncharacterized membrane protein